MEQFINLIYTNKNFIILIFIIISLNASCKDLPLLLKVIKSGSLLLEVSCSFLGFTT